MAYIISNDRYEFNLTVKKYGDKNTKGRMYDYAVNKEEKPEEELKEELTFNCLSAVEVMRKLLDYLMSK